MEFKRIEFLKDVIVNGDLTVQGTSYSESAEQILTKGALTVINADNNDLDLTLMGTVIRTGKKDDNDNYIDYAIIYDPLNEAVRLGVGIYNTDENTFAFNEGEGQPVATRDLGEDDDGCLVMWDAKNYCLVRSTVNVAEAIPAMISTTYAELKQLRDDSKLIPGAFYRITDYECTTSQAGSRAMNNKFDIIVQALSTNTLSEDAKADYHYNEDGSVDGYFLKSVGNALKPDAITVHYTVYEDYAEKNEIRNGAYHDVDKFVAYDYLVNDEGDVVPAIYKTDITDYTYDDPDYQDIFYYIGTDEMNGVTYDKWQMINEDVGPYWDGSVGYKYIYTNIIVENNIIRPNAIMLEKVANLPAWELKYCLDNDTTRFAWADTSQSIINLNSSFSQGAPLTRQPAFDGAWADEAVSEYSEYYYAWGTQADVDDNDCRCFWYSKTEFLNQGDTVYQYSDSDGEFVAAAVEITTGKGVIYYMKDEWGNECPYDFKNIQFTRKLSFPYGSWPVLDTETGNDTWVYTFCGSISSGSNTYSLGDGSLIGPHEYGTDTAGGGTFHRNIIKPRIISSYQGRMQLNDNVLLGQCDAPTPGNIGLAYCCNNNTFDANCGSNTLGCCCSFNTFGSKCFSNTLGAYCMNNTFGNDCTLNTFGNQCCSNTFGNDCSFNTMDSSGTYNIFETSCMYITVSGSPVQHVRVCQGVSGKYKNNLILAPTPNLATPIIYRASGTQEIILD
jgi:hypothetical protein